MPLYFASPDCKKTWRQIGRHLTAATVSNLGKMLQRCNDCTRTDRRGKDCRTTRLFCGRKVSAKMTTTTIADSKSNLPPPLRWFVCVIALPRLEKLLRQKTVFNQLPQGSVVKPVWPQYKQSLSLWSVYQTPTLCTWTVMYISGGQFDNLLWISVIITCKMFCSGLVACSQLPRLKRLTYICSIAQFHSTSYTLDLFVVHAIFCS